jgi:hypothetical protein
MRLTNDTYLILIGSATSGSAGRYYRDKDGWLKVSLRVKHHEQFPGWVMAGIPLPSAVGPR